jgi:outer membrane protein assembly factor BamB
VGEGLVLIGSWDDNLYALGAGIGEKRWEFRTGGLADLFATWYGRKLVVYVRRYGIT